MTVTVTSPRSKRFPNRGSASVRSVRRQRSTPPPVNRLVARHKRQGGAIAGPAKNKPRHPRGFLSAPESPTSAAQRAAAGVVAAGRELEIESIDVEDQHLADP